MEPMAALRSAILPSPSPRAEVVTPAAVVAATAAAASPPSAREVAAVAVRPWGGRSGALLRLRRLPTRPLAARSHAEAAELRSATTLAAAVNDNDDDDGFRHESAAEARDVVVRLFEAINRRDLELILSFIDDGCAHHDLAFFEPHEGKKAVAKFYKDLIYRTPSDMKFKIEDLTEGDPFRVGVIWHIEVGGVEVPTSQGVSFYRINPKGYVCYVREGPEHFVKLAEAALPALTAGSPVIRTVVPFLKQIPQVRRLPFLSRASTQISPDLLAKQIQSQKQFSAADLWAQSAKDAEIEKVSRQTNSGNVPTNGNSRLTINGASPDINGSTILKAPTAQMHNGNGASVIVENNAIVNKNGLSNGNGAIVVEDKNSAEHKNGSLFPPNLTGTWVKDEEASDQEAYDRGLNLMKLSDIQKQTAKLITAVELVHEKDMFSQHFVTVVPQFKVTERYSFSYTTKNMRRDLRLGKQSAKMRREGDTIIVEHSWPNPVAGKLVEEFVCPSKGLLHLISTVEVGGESSRILMVYHRKK